MRRHANYSASSDYNVNGPREVWTGHMEVSEKGWTGSTKVVRRMGCLCWDRAGAFVKARAGCGGTGAENTSQGRLFQPPFHMYIDCIHAGNDMPHRTPNQFQIGTCPGDDRLEELTIVLLHHPSQLPSPQLLQLETTVI